MFYDEKKKEQETIRIYSTESMLDNLIDLNFVQWFFDGTFKIVPKVIIMILYI